MGRWQPGAAGRLRAAAMELFVERGYEQTTVTDIAERAGLTGRTFFRHFADKREVLFAGSDVLQAAMLDALAAAPAGSTPMTAVGAALRVAGTELGGNRELSRQRQTLVVAHAELRERELIKFDTLSAAMAAGLRERGVGDPEASLAAEAGMAVFRVGWERWIAAPSEADLGAVMADLLERLGAVTAR